MADRLPWWTRPPATTAAFMVAVPALGSIFGVIMLNEVPGVIGWMSLFVLTPGILLVAIYSRAKRAAG